MSAELGINSDDNAISKGEANKFESFINSELTALLIGKNVSHYIARWTRLFEQSERQIAKASEAFSWSWPAFLSPQGSFLYRKFYIQGFLFLTIQCAALILPGTNRT